MADSKLMQKGKENADWKLRMLIREHGQPDDPSSGWSDAEDGAQSRKLQWNAKGDNGTETWFAEATVTQDGKDEVKFNGEVYNPQNQYQVLIGWLKQPLGMICTAVGAILIAVLAWWIFTANSTTQETGSKEKVADNTGAKPAPATTAAQSPAPAAPASKKTPDPIAPSVIDIVKNDVRTKVQEGLKAATARYTSVKADYDAAVAEMAQLDAAKAALGKAWCKENQDAYNAAKEKADAATTQMNGLTSHIYVLQDQLENGGAAVLTLDMLNGLSMQVATLDAKVDRTSAEVKSTLADTKKELLGKIAALDTSMTEKLGALEKATLNNLTMILTRVAAIPGQTAEDLKDLEALVAEVKKEVLKHKDSPTELKALEMRLKAMEEKLLKLTTLQTAPAAASAQAPATPVKRSAPIQTPTVIHQGAQYAPPACQGVQCQQPMVYYRSR